MMLISVLAKASILLAATFGTEALLARRGSAAIRHSIWTLAIVGLLLLPVLSAALPAWQVMDLPAPAARIASPLAGSLGPEATTSSIFEDGVSTPASVETSASDAATSIVSVPWPLVPGAVYALGVLALLARAGWALLAVKRLAKRAVPVRDPEWTELLAHCAERIGVRRTVTLLRTSEHTIPMAIGTWRAAILIPRAADEWPDDRRRAVLLHELAHVSRRDCLTQTLAAVACALYWIHPGAWWAARRLRTERELACDDRVLSAGANARDYASHLLEIAYSMGRRRGPALAVSMATPRQLEGRMLAVLDAARNRAVPALGSRVAAVGLLVALIIPVAAATAAVDSGPESTPALLRSTDEPLVAPPVASGLTSLQRAPSSPAAQRAPAAPAPSGRGETWEIRPTSTDGQVHLQLRENDSSRGSRVNLDRLDGLSLAQLAGSGPVRFELRREAGTFSFEGVARGGVAAGTYVFTANAEFGARLPQRGLQRPTPEEQRRLAASDVGIAFLDEMERLGYARPSATADLIRAADHGVDLAFLREMADLGYRLGRLEALISLRDSGVNPAYVRELTTLGYRQLSADALIQLRQHGVDPMYIRELGGLGYPKLSLDDLTRLRNHGVDPTYIRDLASLGHRRLPLEELIRLRNNGVDPEYIRELATLGYQRLSLPELVRLRSQGVDPSYARELAALGYGKLTLDTLVDLRAHGVDPSYIRELASLGHTKLALDRLVQLRGQGVDPEFVREFDALGYRGLSLDTLIRLRRHGVDESYVRGLQRLGYTKLSVDELVELRNHGADAEEIGRANQRAGRRLSVDALTELAARGWR